MAGDYGSGGRETQEGGGIMEAAGVKLENVAGNWGWTASREGKAGKHWLYDIKETY